MICLTAHAPNRDESNAILLVDGDREAKLTAGPPSVVVVCRVSIEVTHGIMRVRRSFLYS
jgi:hypothetical protein